GGTLYLLPHPEFAARSYDALLAARGGAQWKMWADLVVMYRALSDPVDAARQWRDLATRVDPEAGNSRSNVAQWIGLLSRAGRVDRTVTADMPLFAVFRNGDERTYVAYNAAATRRTVHFSDGVELAVEPGAFEVRSRRPTPRAAYSPVP
ncbi:glycoside hydrolase family 81, partial [Myxococcota bacterium]|nr:glycoside hydrolase family 81 [Myxococcota bacterium]